MIQRTRQQTKEGYPQEVYLNGQWLPSSKARISVFDRGFMLGDGIYEVTPFYQGKPFQLQAHLERLQGCLEKIRITFDAFLLKEILFQSVFRAGLADRDCAVYVQVTRGTAARTHHYPDGVEPNVLVYVKPVDLEGFQDRHWEVSVGEDFRWHRCDIKSTSLLANSMANQEAISKGMAEQLLVRSGFFTEGSHSSAFFVKGAKVYTHPEGTAILPGITRRIVIGLCKELGIELREEAFPLADLGKVEEVFMTGTTTQVMYVAAVYQGKDLLFSRNKGPITSRLQQAFLKLTRGRSIL